MFNTRIKDALASCVEIMVAPSRRSDRSFCVNSSSNLKFSSRFGGVSFGGRA